MKGREKRTDVVSIAENGKRTSGRGEEGKRQERENF